jgi:hypothetical protein
MPGSASGEVTLKNFDHIPEFYKKDGNITKINKKLGEIPKKTW